MRPFSSGFSLSWPAVGFFIMVDTGRSLTSSSSKDAVQQHSVDQDTPAQGVYSYICNLFIWFIYWRLTPWPCLCCNIDDSLSLYCCFHVVTLLILMFWEYFPIEIHMSTPVKQAQWKKNLHLFCRITGVREFVHSSCARHKLLLLIFRIDVLYKK